jgi:hypothetical protein
MCSKSFHNLSGGNFVMKKRKYAVALVALVLLLCAQSGYSQVDYDSTKNQDRYRVALALIMKRLENKMEISFSAEPPLVKFAAGRNAQSLHFGEIGKYVPETKTIFISGMLELCDLTDILQFPVINIKKNQIQKVSKEVCGTMEFRQDLLAHELGHYYVDLMVERQFPESWLFEARRRKQTLLSLDDQLGIPIVSEGIATYFGKALGKNTDPSFNEKRWNQKYSEKDLTPILTEHIVYNGGYSLVKPIIDRYGYQGIAYLVSHPLTIKFPDLSVIIVYREKTLQYLYKESEYR